MGLLGGQSGPRVGSGPVGSIPTPVNAAICQQRGDSTVSSVDTRQVIRAF